MNSRPKRTTIYDIASHCGVSVATVSRVLSHADYPVSEATRQAVIDAARELRYTPNLLGKNLKTQRCRDIGVIIPNLTNYCYTALLQGIYNRAIANKYNIILCNSYRNPSVEQANIELLLQKQVAGIIVSSISPDSSSIEYAMEYGCKVVAVEQTVKANCGKVQLDWVKGAYMAVQHLIEQGHQRIGFMGAPLDRSSRVQMLEGYTRCLIEHGIAPQNELILLAADETESDSGEVYEFENGRRLADRFLSFDPIPTGYLTLNDMTAMSAMKQFAKRGYRVPEQISIIGFDNIPFCETATPALTTLDKCAEETGTIATQMLIDSIEHPDRPCETVTIEPKLVLRGSVQPPMY